MSECKARAETDEKPTPMQEVRNALGMLTDALEYLIDFGEEKGDPCEITRVDRIQCMAIAITARLAVYRANALL